MPTIEEYRQWEAQARKDAEDYRWYGQQHPSREAQYERMADNRLGHADWYRQQYEELERVNGKHDRA